MLNRFYQSLESIVVSEFTWLYGCVKYLTFNAQGLMPVMTRRQKQYLNILNALEKCFIEKVSVLIYVNSQGLRGGV